MNVDGVSSAGAGADAAGVGAAAAVEGAAAGALGFILSAHLPNSPSASKCQEVGGLTFETITTRKSFSLIFNEDTVAPSCKIFPEQSQHHERRVSKTMARIPQRH